MLGYKDDNNDVDFFLFLNHRFWVLIKSINRIIIIIVFHMEDIIFQINLILFDFIDLSRVFDEF